VLTCPPPPCLAELRHRPWLQDGVDASSSIYPPPMLDPASQVAEGPRKPGGA
jgi:hypothetical protein